MSTPMDIDPPTSSAASEITLVDDVKGKGKEEKPRFEVKKVCLHFTPSNGIYSNANIYRLVECSCSLGLG